MVRIGMQPSWKALGTVCTRIYRKLARICVGLFLGGHEEGVASRMESVRLYFDVIEEVGRIERQLASLRGRQRAGVAE